MSVTEADVMAAMGEQVNFGPSQTAEYSAAIERQYAYEAAQREAFNNPDLFAPGEPGWVAAVAMPTPTATLGGGGAGFTSALGSNLLTWQETGPAVPTVPTDPVGPRNYPVPVPPEPAPAPPPWWSRGILGPIGAAIGGILWEGWPNELSPEAGPIYQPAPPYDPSGEGGALGPYPDPLPPSPAQPPPMGLPLPDDDDEPTGPQSTPDPWPIDLPRPGGPYPWELGPAVPAPAPPAPAPAPSTREKIEEVVEKGINVLGWLGIGLGGAGLASSLSRSSMTVPQVSDFAPPIPDPLTPINDGLLGFLQPQTATSSWADQDRCQCKTKSRKKRKCLQRAQLSWRSGPKKGKPAGSRCIRFQN